MHVERHEIEVTTAVGGAVTAYSPVITGRILAIRYAKTDFAAGVDFTITVESSGEGLWTEENVDASKIVYPTAQVHDVVGQTLTMEGSEPLTDRIHVANDRVKIVIAAGGDAKTGTFHILVG
ncbi:MAG TPA: hypothetical protein VMY35_14950 [Phycisphaerae bacterium]|nr:hypothetical protein [Phycisphaerae bacterium]